MAESWMVEELRAALRDADPLATSVTVEASSLRDALERLDALAAAQDTPDAAERRARALLDGATPGPWTHERVGYGQHAVTPDARSEIFVEREGDAALMAAAPDLARNVIDLAAQLRAAVAHAATIERATIERCMKACGELVGTFGDLVDSDGGSVELLFEGELEEVMFDNEEEAANAEAGARACCEALRALLPEVPCG